LAAAVVPKGLSAAGAVLPKAVDPKTELPPKGLATAADAAGCCLCMPRGRACMVMVHPSDVLNGISLGGAGSRACRTGLQGATRHKTPDVVSFR
jgi:hypothetical protein